MQTTTGRRPSGAARLLAPAGEVVAEASEWHVGPRVALTAFLTPILGAAAVGAARGNRALFDFLTREDSLLEWLQFAGYAAAAVLGLVLAARMRSAAEPWAARACLLFAAANTFVAGEEISWGQRIVGWGTPEVLENKQHETTIHNAPHVISLFNLALLGIGLAGATLPWLARRNALRWIWRPLVPPLFLTSAFLVLFAYKSFRLTVYPRPGFTAVRYGEWSELCLAGAFAFWAYLALRRSRASGSESSR